MLTPTSNPSAHAVSVSPTTRLRRANSTWSMIQAPMLRSNTILNALITTRPTVNAGTFGARAVTKAPAATPVSPTVIAVRRDMRSTTVWPMSGEATAQSSAIVRAMAISEIETSKPRAMTARNGAAKR